MTALRLCGLSVLGTVVLGYPLFLLYAVVVAGFAFGPWVYLLLIGLPGLAVAWAAWLLRPASHRRSLGALLLGGVAGGAFWFSRFGLAGLV